MSSTAITLPRSETSIWPRVGWILLLLGALLSAGTALMFTAFTDFNADYVETWMRRRLTGPVLIRST